MAGRRHTSLSTEAMFEAAFRTGAGRSLTRGAARGRKVTARGGGDPRCAKAGISGAVKEEGGSGSLMVVVGGGLILCVLLRVWVCQMREDMEHRVERASGNDLSLIHFDVQCWEFDVRRSTRGFRLPRSGLDAAGKKE